MFLRDGQAPLLMLVDMAAQEPVYLEAEEAQMQVLHPRSPSKSFLVDA